jgi:hypothetical protein
MLWNDEVRGSRAARLDDSTVEDLARPESLGNATTSENFVRAERCDDTVIRENAAFLNANAVLLGSALRYNI